MVLTRRGRLVAYTVTALAAGALGFLTGDICYWGACNG